MLNVLKPSNDPWVQTCKDIAGPVTPHKAQRGLAVASYGSWVMPLVNGILFVNGTNGYIPLHCFTSQVFNGSYFLGWLFPWLVSIS